MPKRKKKIIGLAIFFASFFPALALASAAFAAGNYEQIYFTPQVEIPNSAITGQVPVGTIGNDGYVRSTLLVKYIAGIYNYGLSIGGILAAVMLMAGGLIWLTSGGDSGKVGQAKKLIGGSIIGLVLLFGAYLLLNTVNPDLTNLEGMKVLGIKAQISEDASDGMIESLESAPTDTKAYWGCANSIDQTCSDFNPPMLTLDIKLCYESAANSKPSCGEGLLRCCGLSQIDQTNRDSDCAGKKTGTACRVSSTGSLGSGYCESNDCKPCKNIDAACSGSLKNYECVGASGLCGRGGDGTNDCNCKNGSCTCVLNK